MRLLRAVLTGLTVFVAFGMGLNKQSSDAVDLRAVVAVLTCLTSLAWLHPYRPRGAGTRLLGFLAWILGCWGIFHLPRPDDDPSIDWLFPYYFSLAISGGFASLLAPPGRLRKRALRNAGQWLHTPGLVLLPLAWPLIAAHAVLTADNLKGGGSDPLGEPPAG